MVGEKGNLGLASIWDAGVLISRAVDVASYGCITERDQRRDPESSRKGISLGARPAPWSRCHGSPGPGACAEPCALVPLVGGPHGGRIARFCIILRGAQQIQCTGALNSMMSPCFPLFGKNASLALTFL